MSTFQDTRDHTEQKLMVHLLSEIERNPSFTQRGLAGELGIALGLMNQYLKRCITKGWIRVSQISPRRITYFLTPDGFKEKSHMVKDYLARSMTFFRDARAQCQEAFDVCNTQGWKSIALIGNSDLVDIAKLVAEGTGLKFTILELAAISGISDRNSVSDINSYDAVMITDVLDPQGAYNAVRNKIDPTRLLILKLLHISEVST